MTSGTHAIIVSIALDLGITVCLACVAVKDWGGARVSDSVSSVHAIFSVSAAFTDSRTFVR